MWLVVKTARRRQAGAAARPFAWLAGCQRELSDRLHGVGDAQARQRGWEITTSTGRFGFGARTYRDPRFEDWRGRFTTEAARVDEGDYPDTNRYSKAGTIRMAGRPAARCGAQRQRADDYEAGE